MLFIKVAAWRQQGLNYSVGGGGGKPSSWPRASALSGTSYRSSSGGGGNDSARANSFLLSITARGVYSGRGGGMAGRSSSASFASAADLRFGSVLFSYKGGRFDWKVLKEPLRGWPAAGTFSVDPDSRVRGSRGGGGGGGIPSAVRDDLLVKDAVPWFGSGALDGVAVMLSLYLFSAGPGAGGGGKSLKRLRSVSAGGEIIGWVALSGTPEPWSICFSQSQLCLWSKEKR